MADPRKTIRCVTGDEERTVREIVNKHLIDCTIAGATELGCTGASFVALGVGMWAAEMAELDGKATAQFLRALADMVEPGRSREEKQEAEARRQQAVKRLMAAVDLMMNDAEGRA